MRFTRIVVLFTLSLVMASAIGNELPVTALLSQPADAELVDSENHSDPGPQLVVLGALEKVNQELRPEASREFLGRRQSATWHLAQTRRTRTVIRFFQDQMDEIGEQLFSCKGRTCGSSSYWANRVFDRSILYGPEQHQYYTVHQDTNGDYIALYIGQRATRKVYVHLVIVKPTE